MSHYEMPPQPNCLSCDGRGWYFEDNQDRRCPCWVVQFILCGPPEQGIPLEAMW